MPDEFKGRDQIAAGFESLLFWWSTINKNVNWINYLYYNQPRFVNYTSLAVRGLHEQLDKTSLMTVVMSGRPVGVTFPNQFSLGNPENVSGKLEINFDDLIVESIQRKTFREIQKRQKAERRKRAKKRDGSSKDNQPDQENCFIDA